MSEASPNKSSTTSENVSDPSRGAKRSADVTVEEIDPSVPQASLDAPQQSGGVKRDQGQLSAPPLYAGEPSSKKVRAVQVGQDKYYVGDEDLEDWFQGVSFDMKYLEEELPDFSPENEPEPILDEEALESQGHPQLSEDELNSLDEESKGSERDRLLRMGVLSPVEFVPPKEKTLQTRYVLDWRFRSKQWLRRARLVCKELKVWNPFRQDTYSPATSPSMLRLLPHLFTSTPGWELRAFDVKDAFLMFLRRKSCM